MPQNNFNHSGRFSHEQKIKYATHEHHGTEATATASTGTSATNHMHAYSAPQEQHGLAYGLQQPYGSNQAMMQGGQQTQSYQQQPSGNQQGWQQNQSYQQQAQGQQQQMKQQIQQQYQGQYSQLSTKDFNYLKDHMSWELLAAKKCYHYAQECQDGQIANLINQVGQMHERHYNALLPFLSPQNVQ